MHAHRAVLTGCSAGGIGTIFNCDWFAGQFDNATDVACRPEAGWFGLEQAAYPYWISPAGPSSDPDPRKMSASNWTTHVNPWTLASDAGLACAADVASGKRTFDHCEGQELGPAACCGAPPTIYEYSKTRMFVSENQADAYQVYVENECPEAKTCQAQLGDSNITRYWQYIQGTIAGSLTRLVVNGSKQDQDGLFAPACLQHCMHWQGSKVNGRNDQQAFGDWYFRRGRESMTLDHTNDPAHLCACAKV